MLTLDIEKERYRSMMVEEEKYAYVTVRSEPFRRSGSHRNTRLNSCAVISVPHLGSEMTD